MKKYTFAIAAAIAAGIAVIKVATPTKQPAVAVPIQATNVISSPAKVPSVATATSSDSSRIPPERLAIVAPPRMVTNHFVFDEAPSQNAGYQIVILHHGTNSGSYFEAILIPYSTSFTAATRHWLFTRDYFMVTVVNEVGIESIASNEWPPPWVAKTSVLITLASPGLVQASVDMANWVIVSSTASASYTLPLTEKQCFFRGVGRTNSVTITAK